MGRPYVQIDMAHVERLATLGCSADEIAAELGVSERTIWRRCGRVLSRGAKKSHLRIRSALMKYALQGNAALIIFLAKSVLGLREPREDAVTVNVSASASAIGLGLSDQQKKQIEELAAQIHERAFTRVRERQMQSANGDHTTSALN